MVTNPRHDLLLPVEALKRKLNGTELCYGLEQLINTTFLASVEREEGEFGGFRIVYHPEGIQGLEKLREHLDIGSASGSTPAWYVLQLDSEESVSQFTVGNVAKMASMTREPRTAIVVGDYGGELRIQGLARRRERHEYYQVSGEADVLVFSSGKPGQVIVSVEGEVLFWYESGRTLAWTEASDLWNLLHKEQSIVRQALFAICSPPSKKRTSAHLERSRYYLIGRALRRIIQTMRDAKHGGLMSIVPRRCCARLTSKGKFPLNQESRGVLRSYIIDRAEYDVEQRKGWFADPPTDDDALFDRDIARAYGSVSLEALDDLSRNVGLLTTVDNALMLGPSLEVLCAGYQVQSRRTLSVKEVSTLDGSGDAQVFHLDRHGSRHRAAVNIANSYRGSVVFLLSEDGDLRCLHRPEDGQDVLLWNLLEPVDL